VERRDLSVRREFGNSVVDSLLIMRRDEVEVQGLSPPIDT
jgi:hypothetical protein